MKLDVYAQQAFIRNGVDIHLVARRGDLRSIGLPIVFETLAEDDGRRHEPTFTLPMAAAQEMMDRLWQCGVRPTEGAGSAGAMAQAEAHIKTLQRVAFGLLERGKD
jgi:hypothetical protein